MTQNIPLAILLGIVGSFCFALSAQVQHGAVGEEVQANHAKQRMDRKGLLRLIKSPRWWRGLLLMGVSAAAQIVALTMAPVSVVQPVGLLAFPWSVLLSARKHGHRLGRPLMVAVAVTVVATLGFTIVAAKHASAPDQLDGWGVVTAALIVYATAAVMTVFGSKGPRAWRCLFWASGGALFYGLEAALVKALIEFARTHAGWLTDPLMWGIGVALILGSALAGLLIQQGYATGPAEVVVGSMTVTSPVVAVLFGIAVLGEGHNITLWVGAAMVLLGLIAIAGVAALTRLHPHYEDTGDSTVSEVVDAEAESR